MSKLEKAYADSSEVVSKLKAEVKYIEDQWERSAFKIKENMLMQCQVICPEADFREVKLNKHIVNRNIEVTPDDKGGDLEDPKFEPSNLAADL